MLLTLASFSLFFCMTCLKWRGWELRHSKLKKQKVIWWWCLNLHASVRGVVFIRDFHFSVFWCSRTRFPSSLLLRLPHSIANFNEALIYRIAFYILTSFSVLSIIYIDDSMHFMQWNKMQYNLQYNILSIIFECLKINFVHYYCVRSEHQLFSQCSQRTMY